MILYGTHGECWWTYFTGQVVDQDLKDFITMFRFFTESRPNCLSALVIEFRCDRISMDQITYLIQEVVSMGTTAQQINAVAFVGDYMRLKSIFNIIDLKISRPYPFRIFEKPSQALAWLAMLRPNVNPKEIWDSIAKSLPPELLMDEKKLGKAQR
jgi:N-glycosylase/DNA lyase